MLTQIGIQLKFVLETQFEKLINRLRDAGKEGMNLLNGEKVNSGKLNPYWLRTLSSVCSTQSERST